MNRVLISMLVLVLGVSLGAAALTGSGNSSPGPLETVAPTVLSAMAATTASISVTFSEPMVSAGVLNPANYTLSGVGMGTLAQHPASVTGAEPYTLTWSTGEMRDGQSVNVTVAGVQDLVGNPISPAANSASYPGKGIAPVFSSLVASPAQAASGDSVTLTFTASEALTGEPELAVNGRAATFVSGVANAYTFTYVVADTDTLGMATIAVSGFDLAGNPGGLSSSTTLEIIQKAPGLPLYTWPGALLLLAIGTLVLRRLLKSPFEGGAAKRRGMFFLALVAFGALACSSAFAAPPAVTNVTFSQGPNGTTATQADIYYDLTAPNGPCDITVSLSKDGGADGFIHAVTTVTGDVIGVTAGTDKHIVWNIAADYPNETIANAAIRVLADDHLVQHAVTYAAVPPAGGSLLGGNAVIDDTTGTTSFTVAANPGYVIDAVTVSNGTLTGTGPYTLSNVTADTTVTASFSVPPVSEVSTFAINSGATTTMPLAVTLDNTATNVPVDYMASESASFTGAAWQPYGTAPAFTLSFGVGTRTVYFKVRDAALVESGVVSDTIFLVPQTVPVAAGTFAMGRRSDGDDQTYGSSYADELPTHSVTLGAYTLGKCEMTNKEYCDVLNWALSQGYLYSDAAGTAWPGSGNIYAGGAGFRFLIVSFSAADCTIQYSGGLFTSQMRVGLPGTTNYSMDTHPMLRVSWYGSVAFCNWLSQWQGLTPCYDMGATDWPLTVAPPTTGGYRLPTEAEWERAAAWDGTKHWIYGFLSDTNVSGTANRCNDYNSGPPYDNPLGLTAMPYTSPVGWFNGVNVNPNGGATTVNSPSPVGAYDMSGNVWEWCQDMWDGSSGYGAGAVTNPIGASGAYRVDRGGSWTHYFDLCRSAYRSSYAPAGTYNTVGFRLARTVTTQYALTYTAGANGTISGTTPQMVVSGGSGTAVTAVADAGYVFSQWSDGVLTATRTDTNVMANITVTATFIVPPVVTSFAINSGAATTMPLAVTLDNTATNGPVDYMASESASFTGAVWTAYGTAPAFTLSFGVGTRTVYFKVRDAALVESGVVSDTIFLVPQTVPVAAGTFPMGRLASGTNDDRTYGGTYEDPVHSVTLGAYTLGKCEVTNKEYCDVLNWAKAQGYLYSDAAGTAWAGTGDIYAGGAGFRFLIVSFSSTNCNIQHSGGVFTSKTRVGLPGTTNYSMDTHPMVMVSWYGSVAFCNWLSQWQGVATCYNMGAANWPLTVAPPTAGGYRLPTEAEWERAAAWDGTKHWIYGFLSDTNATGTANRCNDFNSFATAYDNPLGLTAYPYTSPVGWFNGVNVNPNGSVTTVNSPSPVGAYDMSGNVYEWCGDWYLDTYYTSGGPPWNNPTGPASGTRRVNRGSAWNYSFFYCRSAYRTDAPPAGTNFNLGFRLSRS